jgi:tRNA dimethylallyltransferase
VLPTLVVIVGPTGAGKSELAIELAEACGGEVVSADSQQVYRGMDIGTGKVGAAERARVRHHLIDIVDPDDEMTAARFAGLADAAIAEAGERDAPVVVAGGTGLYIRALLLGLFEGPPADQAIRNELGAIADEQGTEALWTMLDASDPEMAERIHRTDRKRLIRALEVHRLTGVLMSEHQKRHDHRTMPPRYPHRLVALAPERELLYQRIDARVDAMLQAGLIAEVEGLRGRGYGPELRSQQAIGYQEIHQHLDGVIDLAEATRLIKRNSRRYARRQLSWYRNGPAAPRARWYSEKSEVDLADLRRYLRQPPEDHG